MVSYVAVEGYRDYVNFVENVDPDGPPTYFYFYGTRMSNGVSWCDDSAYIEPIIRSYLRDLRDYIIFVFVGVGYRNDWKKMSCPFRTDDSLRLTVIPTLVKHGSSQRLEGSQCTNTEFLDMIFNKQTFDGDKARAKTSSDEIVHSRGINRKNKDPDESARYRSSKARSDDDYHYKDRSQNRQNEDSFKTDPAYRNNQEDPQQSRLARRPHSQQNSENNSQQSSDEDSDDSNSRYRERIRYGNPRRRSR